METKMIDSASAAAFGWPPLSYCDPSLPRVGPANAQAALADDVVSSTPTHIAVGATRRLKGYTADSAFDLAGSTDRSSMGQLRPSKFTEDPEVTKLGFDNLGEE
jgi:hypothetical protein